MDGEMREHISETLELTQDNNRILHSIQRARRWAFAWSVIKWVVIISSSVGIYYYYQPQIENIMELWQTVSAMLESAKDQLNAVNSAFTPR